MYLGYNISQRKKHYTFFFELTYFLSILGQVQETVRHHTYGNIKVRFGLCIPIMVLDSFIKLFIYATIIIIININSLCVYKFSYLREFL